MPFGSELVIKIIGDASKLTSELEKASGNVKSFSEKIGSIGKSMTIVGGAVTAALGIIIKKTVDAGDAFNDMSLRTGIAVETLSALDYAGKQTGTAIEAIELSLKFLTKAMDDTSKGTGTAKDTFAALGITVVDTEGKLRPVVDVMKDIADKVAAIDDPAKQAAIAMELFGARSGTQLLPMLKLGAGGIDDLMKKAQELGIVMSTKDAQAADEFKNAMGRLTLVLGAAGKDIANVLIPPLLDFTNKAIEIVKRIREWADTHKPLIEAIILIGAKLAVFAAVGGPILMAVSALAKLKTAFTVFGMVGSGPIGIFIVAVAAIATGAVTLAEKIDIATGSMKGFREEVNKFDLAKIDAEIQTLSDEANELQLILSETKMADYVRKNMSWSLEEINNKLLILYESREKLTAAEKEGIITTETFIPLTNELGDAYLTIADRMYELIPTQETLNLKIGESIGKLYKQAQVYQDLGVPMKVVAEWVELESEGLMKLNEALKGNELSAFESKLDYIRSKFEKGKPSIEGYKDEIYILEDTLGNLKEQFAASTPESDKYWDFKTAIEETEGKIKLLNAAVDDTVAGRIPAVEALDAMGVGFTGLKDDAFGAREAMKEANTAFEKSNTVVIDKINEITTSYGTLITKLDEVAKATVVSTERQCAALKTVVNAIGEVTDVTLPSGGIISTEPITQFVPKIENGTITLPGGGTISVPVKSYQAGISYVPKTGLALIHQGEKITSAGQNTTSYAPTINIINPIVRNDDDITKIRNEVKKAHEELVRQYGRTGYAPAY
jgi:hypothetical protein